MPLIVEDGTVVPNANTYVTVDEIDQFYEDRNILDWAGVGASNQEKDGFALLAADYLNSIFAWVGDPVEVDQPLPLPTDLIAGIPLAVKRAQILLAKEAAAGTLPATVFGERAVTMERQKLEGVGESEVRYSDDTPSPFALTNSYLIGLLRPYTAGPSSGIQIARREYV